MKVLIEVNSNVGDLTMNIPILNYFKNHFENVSFDIIADRRSASLLSEFKGINNIYIKEKNIKQKTKLFIKLLKNKYDYAIGLRSDAVPLVIRAKKKLYKTDRDESINGKVSETIYHFSILKKLFDVKDDEIDTKISFSEDSLKILKDMIDYQEDDKILIIGPGATFVDKTWPKENYVELLNILKDKFTKVLLIGSPKEFELCEEISKKTGALNLSSKTTLAQIAAIVTLGKLFIGNDSRLGHIAAAQGTKTLSIFGLADPIRYTPYKQYSIYREDQNIKKISVKDVLEKLKKEKII